MAAIKLKQLYGGGQFKAEFFSGSLTHSLSSATPLTISPPAGKTLRLDFLAAAEASIIADTSVSVGGVTIINNLDLLNSYAATGFVVSNGITNSGSLAAQANAVQPLIAFDSDQNIVISTISVAANNIYYSYSYGE